MKASTIHTLLLAVPASALSLSNFQLITSSSVPLTCILAYNQQLGNCALSDFTQSLSQQQRRDGNTCSAQCQAGIAVAQQTIKTSCSGLRGVGSTGVSVLGVALTGDLVGLLCGGATTTSTANTSVSASTASTAAALTNNVNGVATAATEATTASTTATTTSESTTSAITSASITSTIDTTADDTAEASLSLLLASLSSLSFFSATVTPESFVQSAETSITVKTGKSSTSTSTATSKDIPRETLSDSIRGGGSPFDAQVVNGAVRMGPSICASVAVVGGIVAVLW